ncbi:11863_t:CDS:2 [Funneliformis geosporum]|uniref:11863_t:CDS:1 n=1 Tax=Funneliformis geosporum TaxID=1117311 RepID=A0A9W4SLF7_9GLOM|nr:11863_t:CDS:2 [Funneliformis geosporum]
MSSSKNNRFFGRYKNSKAVLEPNISGIFISCVKTKEPLCIRECYDLFDEYADKIYKSTDENPSVDEGGSDKDDVETSIAKEIAQMKQPHKSRRFASIQTGANCVVFIKTNPPVNPVQLVHSILTDLYNTGQKKTRFTMRLVPIAQTCYANMNDINRMAEEILKPRFYALKDDQQKIRYAVIPNIRHNHNVDRMELITMIAKLVGDQHIVNLDDPELVIIVDVFKSICGMSILEDYNKLKKYNIEKIFEELNEKKDEESIKKVEQ